MNSVEKISIIDSSKPTTMDVDVLDAQNPSNGSTTAIETDRLAADPSLAEAVSPGKEPNAQNATKRRKRSCADYIRELKDLLSSTSLNDDSDGQPHHTSRRLIESAENAAEKLRGSSSNLTLLDDINNIENIDADDNDSTTSTIAASTNNNNSTTFTVLRQTISLLKRNRHLLSGEGTTGKNPDDPGETHPAATTTSTPLKPSDTESISPTITNRSSADTAVVGSSGDDRQTSPQGRNHQHSATNVIQPALAADAGSDYSGTLIITNGGGCGGEMMEDEISVNYHQHAAAAADVIYMLRLPVFYVESVELKNCSMDTVVKAGDMFIDNLSDTDKIIFTSASFRCSQNLNRPHQVFLRIRDKTGTQSYPCRVKCTADASNSLQLCATVLKPLFTEPKSLHSNFSFMTRHGVDCRLMSVENGAVSVLGQLPQDLVGSSFLTLFHRDDLPLLKEAHDQLVLKKHVRTRARIFRFLLANGDSLISETEWSTYCNPWTRKIEFVVGHHKVNCGPEDVNVFTHTDRPHPNAFRDAEVDLLEKEFSEILQKRIPRQSQQQASISNQLEKSDKTQKTTEAGEVVVGVGENEHKSNNGVHTISVVTHGGKPLGTINPMPVIRDHTTVCSSREDPVGSAGGGRQGGAGAAGGSNGCGQSHRGGQSDFCQPLKKRKQAKDFSVFLDDLIQKTYNESTTSAPAGTTHPQHSFGGGIHFLKQQHSSSQQLLNEGSMIPIPTTDRNGMHFHHKGSPDGGSWHNNDNHHQHRRQTETNVVGGMDDEEVSGCSPPNSSESGLLSYGQINTFEKVHRLLSSQPVQIPPMLQQNNHQFQQHQQHNGGIGNDNTIGRFHNNNSHGHSSPINNKNDNGVEECTTAAATNNDSTTMCMSASNNSSSVVMTPNQPNPRTPASVSLMHRSASTSDIGTGVGGEPMRLTKELLAKHTQKLERETKETWKRKLSGVLQQQQQQKQQQQEQGQSTHPIMTMERSRRRPSFPTPTHPTAMFTPPINPTVPIPTAASTAPPPIRHPPPAHQNNRQPTVFGSSSTSPPLPTAAFSSTTSSKTPRLAHMSTLKRALETTKTSATTTITKTPTSVAAHSKIKLPNTLRHQQKEGHHYHSLSSMESSPSTAIPSKCFKADHPRQRRSPPNIPTATTIFNHQQPHQTVTTTTTTSIGSSTKSTALMQQQEYYRPNPPPPPGRNVQITSLPLMPGVGGPAHHHSAAASLQQLSVQRAEADRKASALAAATALTLGHHQTNLGTIPRTNDPHLQTTSASVPHFPHMTAAGSAGMGAFGPGTSTFMAASALQQQSQRLAVAAAAAAAAATSKSPTSNPPIVAIHTSSSSPPSSKLSTSVTTSTSTTRKTPPGITIDQFALPTHPPVHGRNPNPNVIMGGGPPPVGWQPANIPVSSTTAMSAPSPLPQSVRKPTPPPQQPQQDIFVSTNGNGMLLSKPMEINNNNIQISTSCPLDNNNRNNNILMSVTSAKPSQLPITTAPASALSISTTPTNHTYTNNNSTITNNKSSVIQQAFIIPPPTNHSTAAAIVGNPPTKQEASSPAAMMPQSDPQHPLQQNGQMLFNAGGASLLQQPPTTSQQQMTLVDTSTPPAANVVQFSNHQQGQPPVVGVWTPPPTSQQPLPPAQPHHQQQPSQQILNQITPHPPAGGPQQRHQQQLLQPGQAQHHQQQQQQQQYFNNTIPNQYVQGSSNNPSHNGNPFQMINHHHNGGAVIMGGTADNNNPYGRNNNNNGFRPSQQLQPHTNNNQPPHHSLIFSQQQSAANNHPHIMMPPPPPQNHPHHPHQHQQPIINNNNNPYYQHPQHSQHSQMMMMDNNPNILISNNNNNNFHHQQNIGRGNVYSDLTAAASAAAATASAGGVICDTIGGSSSGHGGGGGSAVKEATDALILLQQT